MTIIEARERCAAGVMGYEIKDRTYLDGTGEPECHVDEYTPDLKDICSLDQMRALKARLRELGYGYNGGYRKRIKIFVFEIYKTDVWRMGESDISEGTALVFAAAKIGGCDENRH